MLDTLKGGTVFRRWRAETALLLLVIATVLLLTSCSGSNEEEVQSTPPVKQETTPASSPPTRSPEDDRSAHAREADRAPEIDPAPSDAASLAEPVARQIRVLAENGAPVRDAQLWILEGERFRRLEVDTNDGTANLARSGQVTVAGSAPGFVARQGHLELQEQGPTEFALATASTLQVHLEDHLRKPVAGVVVWLATGHVAAQPEVVEELKKAQLQVQESRASIGDGTVRAIQHDSIPAAWLLPGHPADIKATTDAHGVAIFQNLPPGNHYRFCVEQAQLTVTEPPNLGRFPGTVPVHEYDSRMRHVSGPFNLSSGEVVEVAGVLAREPLAKVKIGWPDSGHPVSFYYRHVESQQPAVLRDYPTVRDVGVGRTAFLFMEPGKNDVLVREIREDGSPLVAFFTVEGVEVKGWKGRQRIELLPSSGARVLLSDTGHAGSTVHLAPSAWAESYLDTVTAAPFSAVVTSDRSATFIGLPPNQRFVLLEYPSVEVRTGDAGSEVVVTVE